MGFANIVNPCALKPVELYPLRLSDWPESPVPRMGWEGVAPTGEEGHWGPETLPFPGLVPSPTQAGCWFSECRQRVGGRGPMLLFS